MIEVNQVVVSGGVTENDVSCRLVWNRFFFLQIKNI
jgi:hypothetical protein